MKKLQRIAALSRKYSTLPELLCVQPRVRIYSTSSTNLITQTEYIHKERFLMRYTSEARLFGPKEKEKSYRFVTGVSAKPKKMDLPIIPKAVAPYISIQVGEDAFFARYDSMGVADGVGGWVGVKGANPALYSLKIMHYAGAQLEKYDDYSGQYDDEGLIDYDIVTPKDILEKSYELANIDAKNEKIVGSTTAMIVLLRHDELRVANIGDCALMIIRGGETLFRSEEQQHSFNYPFQLGPVSKDTPKDTQSFVIKILPGDIIIMGSDGLFDNVFDDEIVDICISKADQNIIKSDPQLMADALLKKAREIAEDSRYASSPFQNRAVKEGLYYQGGKIDDMTILVSIIREDEDSPDRR